MTPLKGALVFASEFYEFVFFVALFRKFKSEFIEKQCKIFSHKPAFHIALHTQSLGALVQIYSKTINQCLKDAARAVAFSKMVQ